LLLSEAHYTEIGRFDVGHCFFVHPDEFLILLLIFLDILSIIDLEVFVLLVLPVFKLHFFDIRIPVLVNFQSSEFLYFFEFLLLVFLLHLFHAHQMTQLRFLILDLLILLFHLILDSRGSISVDHRLGQIIESLCPGGHFLF